MTQTIFGFNDKEMEFQFMRLLGSAAYRAASIGEFLTIATKVGNANPNSWVKELEQLAEWQKDDGMERLVQNHVVSGREQLFRASNSYRAAELFSPSSCETSKRYGLKSADCFSSAISAMDVHFENHTLPYNHSNVLAYFIAPANDGVKRKTIMISSGFDGTMEEEFFFHGFAAIQRDYNVILFAGPGSIDVFRKHPDAFYKPDFDNVVKRVVNHFEFRQEIDMQTLSLMGSGTGSFFAIKAACYDPRIKALIANPPIMDLHAYLTGYMSTDPGKMAASDDFGLKNISSIPDEVLSLQLKIQMEHFIHRFGQDTFRSTFEYLKSFRIEGEISHIDIPCLALISKLEKGEARKQFNEFSKHTNADVYQFSEDQGAADYCQLGNLSFANAVIYDWLDKL